MEFIKKITAGKSGLRYESRFSPIEKLAVLFAAAAPLVAAAVLTSIVFFRGEAATLPMLVIYIVSCVLFLSVTVICIIYLLTRKKYPIDIFIDDDNIYIRGGRGYYKFNRFEVGTVLIPPGICEKDAVTGIGDKNFSVSSSSLIFYTGNTRNKTRAKNTAKLAYILYNIAQNSRSCVNWGLAYDSL